MKILTVLFATAILFVCSARGQSSDDSNFVPFRSDITLELTTPFDLKKITGNWVSIDGKTKFTIRQMGSEFLADGDYFPGVKANGDNAKVSVRGRALTLYYAISHTTGGGGNDVPIAYSPNMDHLIVGTAPYNAMENGQWVNHSGNFATDGIYGKEFQRVKPPAANTQTAQGTKTSKLEVDIITTIPKGFESSYCSYSKIKGEPPIFLSDVMGLAVMKINGVFVKLKLTKTGKGSNGTLIYTYNGGNFEAAVKTGGDFKKGSIILKHKQETLQIPIIGGCESDGGD